MFGDLLNSVINKEQMTRDTVQDALENVAQELKCPYTDFFLMIKPTDKEFNHMYFVCKFDEKGNPKKVREISLKEILNPGEDAK